MPYLGVDMPNRKHEPDTLIDRLFHWKKVPAPVHFQNLSNIEILTKQPVKWDAEVNELCS